MTSSDTEKVLSYEDIDELNQQVVERPVTIFQNLNAPAPCKEDNAESTSLKFYELNRKDFFFSFLLYYFMFFFLWPTICTFILARILARICCKPLALESISVCISEMLPILVCIANFTPPILIAIFYILIVFAPYSLIYFAIVFVVTIIYMLCVVYGIIEDVLLVCEQCEEQSLQRAAKEAELQAE